jgi:alpha-aminoadipate/glutamate carrier protein LysW
MEDEERFCLSHELSVDLKQIEGGNRTMTNCPECEAEINVQGLMIGEVIYCPDCNAELEVLGLEPPEVALAPQVEEDWGE